jgi:thymidylate synthase
MADLIVADNLSTAWVEALKLLVARRGAAVNLNVAFPGGVNENPMVRERLQALLVERKAWEVQTVANSIFPVEMYVPHLGDQAAERLYEMYELTMRLHRRRKPANDRETYFNRLVAYPGPNGPFNQLEYVIARLSKQMDLRSPHSSAYELGLSGSRDDELCASGDLRVQAPGKDRNLYGFPCLSHISLTLERPRLHLTATYRNQTFVERAYGNYVGLDRLLAFLCQEIGCEPGEIECVATHASAQFSEHGKARVERLSRDVQAILSGRAEEVLHV